MIEKPLNDAQFALKAAVRRAVTLAGGPVAAAEVTRADAARLSRYGSANDPLFVPVDVALALDEAAGDDVILRAWANLRGFELQARDAGVNQAANIHRLAGELARGTGEVVAEAIEASADGQITRNEAQRIDEVAANAEQTLVQLRDNIRDAAHGNRPKVVSR
jgi:hypothetical protein